MLILVFLRTVASKCGFSVFEDGAVTNSASHIKSYIDGTIERLGFAPDLYYLHRIDPSKLHQYCTHRITLLTLTQTPHSRSPSRLSTKSGKRARQSTSDYPNALPGLCAKQTPVRISLGSFFQVVADRFCTVAKIDAVQAEYSAFETLHETDDLIATAKELNVAYVAYSPLGHGWLVDDFPYKSPEDFAPDDFRRTGECEQITSQWLQSHPGIRTY